VETEKLKHLEFIQNVITRMNTNSFQIKGMAVTISAALLALYASNKNSYFIIIGILPVFIFWFLDSYYLTQERRFRGLYEDVVSFSETNTQVKPFSMNTSKYEGGKYSYLHVFWSRTICILYLPLILFLAGLFLYINFVHC
jgi:hypothetical protein